MPVLARDDAALASGLNRNERRYFPVLWLFTRRKAGDYTDAVGLGTVLAHLALAFEPHHRNAQPHDPAQLRGDEIGGSVADRPGLRARLLMDVGQARDHREQAFGVLKELDRAVSVDGDEIPCGHH